MKILMRLSNLTVSIMLSFVASASFAFLAHAADPQAKASQASTPESQAKVNDRLAADALSNAARSEKEHFDNFGSYVSCSDSASCNAVLAEINISPGVSLEMTATANDFTGSASHPKGTGKIFRWDSKLGLAEEMPYLHE